MPAYSYVMYRTLENIPENTGYFHAYWHQEELLLGKREYTALDAKGQGKIRGLERHDPHSRQSEEARLRRLSRR